MLGKTMFGCAAAVALCFAASTITTDVSAAPATGAVKSQQPVAKGGSLARPGGKRKCLEAECGGDTIPIDDNYVVRGCQLTPPGQPLPPWCESGRGATRKIRR